jgi:FKBP-type peptidyl-prolyl cis-trans isomerase FkpA
VSVAEAAHRPANTGRAVKLWLGFLLIIAAGIGLAWLGAGKLRPEVSDTGLEFRTMKAGKGEPIRREDVAYFDYILTADDGTVMDSSQQPVALSMEQVYPGFAEAMGKMKEGGRYHFRMPKSLAFRSSAEVPPGFTGEHLTFDVQVRSIIRGGASMMRQLQQMQQGQQQQQGAAPPPAQ